jgi:hypothetical protein
MTGDSRVIVRVISLQEAQAKRIKRNSDNDRLPPAPAMALRAA